MVKQSEGKGEKCVFFLLKINKYEVNKSGISQNI